MQENRHHFCAIALKALPIAYRGSFLKRSRRLMAKDTLLIVYGDAFKVRLGVPLLRLLSTPKPSALHYTTSSQQKPSALTHHHQPRGPTTIHRHPRPPQTHSCCHDLLHGEPLSRSHSNTSHHHRRKSASLQHSLVTAPRAISSPSLRCRPCEVFRRRFQPF
ncbi:hypothetical protein PIB30_076899 [Stylosanthes scabra]|uniref:Uncharacterized protein n=1 Tax=Stylosanthes scabra TaxID=79078 RepID=A0ABU6VQH0_9FABA|nr:hypothetical protein [Stylosanthes scabra]